MIPPYISPPGHQSGTPSYVVTKTVPGGMRVAVSQTCRPLLKGVVPVILRILHYHALPEPEKEANTESPCNE